MKTLLSRIYPILTQSSLMNPRPIIVSSWLCIALTATAQPASAPATTIPNDSVVQLNAFTVKSDLDRGYMASQSISGSRFVTELKEFPFSLQVLSSALLQDIGAQSLPDALAYATGVVAAQSNQASEISVVQRGFVTTLQLRDGTRKPGGFDAVGAERIEVINGPSSVLFGITNPGGTINFLSKKPVHKPLAEFSQTLGSWGTSRTTLDLGGPLGNSGVLAFRMPSSYTSSDGYYVNSSSRKAYTSPVISWQVTPATKIEVGIELQKSDYIPVTSLLAVLDQSRLAFFLPREFNGNTPRMYMDLKTTLPTFSLLHNFGPNWQLRSNSSFYSNSHETFYAARGAVRASLNFAYPRQASFNRVSNDDFQHNTDVVGNFAVLNGSLTAIMGVEYRDSFNRSNLRSSNAPGGVAPPSWLMLSPSTWNYDEDSSSGIVQLANTTTDFQSTAFSLLAQYKSRNNRFTAAGGVRRDTTTSLFRNYLTGGAGQTFDANKVTMQIGGLYWLKPDALSVYANYSTSFLPLTSPLIDINFRPFNPVPVTGKGFETGIRQTLAQGRFAHSLGVYRIEQENLPSVLLRTSTATTVSFYDTQGGVHRSEGVEYNFNGLLTDNMAFFGG
jgi:iron complex outermembrane receptor protein